ncbi:MAG: SDR family oxidoreductase [Pseudomonadota bacterium]
MARFEGKCVLLTGAAGGFGRSVTRMLAAEGACFVLSDFNEAGLSDFSQELSSEGIPHAIQAGDVAKEETSETLVNLALSEFGRLDIAINNAGIGHKPAKLPDVDSDEAQAVVQVDLMGVFFGMKYQIPVMEKANRETGQLSAILNVSSLAGIGGAQTISVYSAAKHGVIGLTKTAALEYARRGIRINAICPSFARTPMVEDELLEGVNTEEAEAHLTRGIPMRRLATADEVTQAMVWACDPANSFLTGQSIAIDGGTSAQ